MDENKSDPNYVRIHDDLVFKMKLMDSIDAWKEYFKGITYTSTHGDYTACQLICDGGRIKAVIDFSSAGCIPAVWEIMRAYIQSGGVSRNGSYLKSQDVSYEWHYIDVDDATWNRNIEERNKRIEEGNGGSDFYVDEGLLNKLLSMFEIPEKAEMDVWYELNR